MVASWTQGRAVRVADDGVIHVAAILSCAFGGFAVDFLAGPSLPEVHEIALD